MVDLTVVVSYPGNLVVLLWLSRSRIWNESGVLLKNLKLSSRSKEQTLLRFRRYDIQGTVDRYIPRYIYSWV